MILDRLVLHDFGVYGGRQEVELTPASPDRPIILFGGMNGGGKTTLLDAIQLCLYGSAANTSNRGTLGYSTFLERSIHRAPGVSDASLELEFSQHEGGALHRFRLHRSWSRSGTGVRERLELLRDGEPDDLAAEHWSEQVEQFMPARIANLFLFDGEKIEGYADATRTSALIGTAIQNLLGLDVVDQLAGDLRTIERRRRTSADPLDPTAVELAAVVRELAEETSRHARAVQDAGALTNELDRRRREMDASEERFRLRGGPLHERRDAMARELEERQREVATLRAELRELAGGALPITLVADLLVRAVASDDAERGRRRDAMTVEAIAHEHAAVLEVLAAVAPETVGPVSRELAARRSARTPAAPGRPAGWLMPETARSQAAHLVGGAATGEPGRATALDGRLRDAARRLALVQAELAGVPSEDGIAELLAARDAARAALGGAEESLGRSQEAVRGAQARMEALRGRETALLDAAARHRFRSQDAQRVVDHSRRVRSTLARFREAVVARHIANIESLVLASFTQLVGKEGLVAGVRIDPADFTLDLRSRAGVRLTPERLSAGERQLLAVAIMWGLARASGRPLPMVIDTPLGRLDSVHRRNLMARYFPVASHQVLLLSTDQEIVGGDLATLRPHVGRSYRLAHAAATGRTVVERGYFEEAA